MLFAHRGFVDKNCPENSIASLKKAYELGFRAIEFDIWFIENNLCLSHDQPKQIKALPSLSDYFIFQNQMKYWCDFKNLNQENASEAMKLLKENIEASKIKMENLYFAPFITDYVLAEKILKIFRKTFGEVNYVAICEDAKKLDALYDFMTKNEVKNLSILHKLIDKNLLGRFKNIEIFAWTVNDENRLRELQTLGIKNFTTDIIIPK